VVFRVLIRCDLAPDSAHRMNNQTRPVYPSEWMAFSAIVSAAATALYFGFLSTLPACGPPRNTWLGRIYFLIPIAIIAVEGVAAVGAGRARHWRASRIAACILLTLAVTVIGGFLVWLHFFAVGDCGD
jgi:hypothetical protein